MNQSIKDFLEFNGHPMYFTFKNSEWWIAIKPICEALDIEYTRIFKNLKQDLTLNELLAEQPIVAADNKTRKMVCLPEKYIYGWLFSIRSKSKKLKEYKLQCYEVLYDYFHGTITQRQKVLLSITSKKEEIQQLEEVLSENEDYKKLIALKKEQSSQGKQLKKMDQDLLSRQVQLKFDS